MKKGFTLVEMLVVITIIAILTAASTASYYGVRKQGWRTRDRATAQQIATAWNVYLQEERSFEFKGMESGKHPSGSGPHETTLANLWPIAPFEKETDSQGIKNWERKGTVYLEIPGEELDRGETLGGGLFDHWKNRFMFSLDTDYDGKVQSPDPRLSGNARDKTGSAIAWSKCGSDSNPGRWAICWQ